MESAGKGSVVKPLLALEREDVTGVLEFRAQGIATQIYSRAGEIVFATGGTLTETLGRMLIRAGRLTEDQVAAVIRRLTDTIVDGESLKFGEILVEYGFMTGDELEIALTQQVRDKILGCVHRGPGDWRLFRNDKRVENVGTYSVRTRPCLVEGALQLPERRIEAVLQLDENRFPEIVAPDNVVSAEFELTKGESAVLADLEGTSTMQFILSTALEDATGPLIAALILGGGVELCTAPSEAKVRGESRSIPPDFRTLRRAAASFDETAQLAKAPVRKPDPFSDPLVKAGLPPKRPSYSTLAVAVPPSQRRSTRQNLVPPNTHALGRSREAFERLKSDLDARKPASKRMRWPDPQDDTQRRLMAESAFHQGRMWLHAEEAERALPGLHRAHELRPEEREYELYVKWAQMLVNDTFKEDAQRASVQALAAKLVRENRDCELGHSILGHCAHHDGHDEAALRFFHRAALLDPKLVDAARLARLLAQRAHSDKTKPGSRPDIKTPRRRDRGGLDASIDEIVPCLTTKPILPSGIREPAPKPVLPKNEDDPKSHRTWDGIGAPAPPPVGPAPPRVVPPPPVPQRTPSPVTSVTSVAALANVPGGSVPIPATQQTPSPAPAVAAPAALPPVAPAPLLPAALPLASVTPPGHSLPPLPISSAPQWNTTSLPAPPPPPSGSSLLPPPNPFAGDGYSSQRNIATSPPAFLRSTSSSATVVVKRSNKAGLVVGLLLTLGVTGAVAFVVGTRVLAPKEATDAGTETRVTTTTHGVATTSATGVVPTAPVTAVVSTPEPVPTPPATTTATPPTPPPTAEPDPTVTSSATVTIARPPPDKSTAILKVKQKGWGHRVFLDGHIVGQGGKDITVPCGPHRVKVGSAGKENNVDIPCGGTIEVE